MEESQSDPTWSPHALFVIEWDRIRVPYLGYPRAARRVPVEIIQHIMRSCTKDALRSFALLSKAFAAPVRALVFRNIFLSQTRILKLSRLLDSSPHIAEEILGLSLSRDAGPIDEAMEQNLISILGRLTHVTELELRNIFYPLLLPSQWATAPQIERLTLDAVYIEDPVSLLSTLATMHCLRELHIRNPALRRDLDVPRPDGENFLVLSTLEVCSELCVWFEHAVSPSHLRHLLVSISKYWHPLPVLSLLESVRGSLETITVCTDTEQDVYSRLTENASPRLRKLEIKATCGTYSFTMVEKILPSAAIHARSLTVGMRVWEFTLEDFHHLFIHLSGLSRTGLRWATFDLYCWGDHVERLERYHLARRMRDYELMYAIIGMMGARPCGGRSGPFVPARIQSERVRFTWWGFTTDDSQGTYIVLEHDAPYDPMRILRIQPRQLSCPKLRAIHFIFETAPINMRDLHIVIQA